MAHLVGQLRHRAFQMVVKQDLGSDHRVELVLEALVIVQRRLAVRLQKGRLVVVKQEENVFALFLVRVHFAIQLN